MIYIPMQGVQLSFDEFMKKIPPPRQQTDAFAAVNSGSISVRQKSSPPVGSPVKHLTSCAFPVGNKIIIWSVILVECSIQGRGTDMKWVNRISKLTDRFDMQNIGLRSYARFPGHRVQLPRCGYALP